MNTLTEKPKKVDIKDLEQKVKAMYRDVALHPEVEYHFEMGRALAERLGYPAEMLDKLPAQAIDSFAGVGHYFDLAAIKEGESVVDLGSGSGMDVFYAALKAGKTGEVIGIDMTDEQLAKSIKLAGEANINQVSFHNSYIETLPIVNASIDVVISNGVINLSSNKASVFQEIARVLKPGGRMVIADIVTTTKLPENISCNATLWAACIGGAMQKAEYAELIELAGMSIHTIKDNPYEFISSSAKGATSDYGIKSISILATRA